MKFNFKFQLTFLGSCNNNKLKDQYSHLIITDTIASLLSAIIDTAKISIGVEVLVADYPLLFSVPWISY